MTNTLQLQTLVATREVLKQARVYVDSAYECAFPDESKNQSVLNDIDEQIKGLTALIREAQGTYPVAEMTADGWTFFVDAQYIRGRAVYAAPEQCVSLKCIRLSNSPWIEYPPSPWYLNRETHSGNAAQIGDRLNLYFRRSEQHFYNQAAMAEFELVQITPAFEAILSSDSVLVQDASRAIGQVAQNTDAIDLFVHKTVPLGTKVYVECLVEAPVTTR